MEERGGDSEAKELSGGSPHFEQNASSSQNKLAGPAGAWLSAPLECRAVLHRLSRSIKSL